MKVWWREFEASYVRENGIYVVRDTDVPLPDEFVNDLTQRSNVVLPPGTRAGDHIHSKREEVFVGFGEGMELLMEDDTKNVTVLKMDPRHHNGKCVVYWIRAEMAHAVRNMGTSEGFMMEFASAPQDSIPHRLSLD